VSLFVLAVLAVGAALIANIVTTLGLLTHASVLTLFWRLARR